MLHYASCKHARIAHAAQRARARLDGRVERGVERHAAAKVRRARSLALDEVVRQQTREARHTRLARSRRVRREELVDVLPATVARQRMPAARASSGQSSRAKKINKGRHCALESGVGRRKEGEGVASLLGQHRLDVVR